jgi:hypothetical protein
MLRAVGSVVVGYVVMSAVVFGLFTCAFLGMGADRAFEPGTYGVSMLWAGVSIAVGLIAAIGGGFVCARIARTSMPPKVLAGLVLGLGLVFAAATLMATKPAEGPPARTAETPSLTAMQYATKMPAWATVLNPFVGAVGVLIGARRKIRADAAS